MTHWPKLILFDLDGTLIDSVPDIRLAVNELMASDGLDPFQEDEVRAMIGKGVATLIARAYASREMVFSAHEMAQRLALMANIYMRHLIGATTVLPGAREALRPRPGCRYALVTNKLQAATESILAHFGLLAAFDLVIGDSGLPLKPNPAMLLHATSTLGVAISDTVMLGDSASDIESARNAGIVSVLVEGGYSTVPPAELGADAIIANLFGLPAALEALAAQRVG